MLDIIFPTPIENIDLCSESLDRIVRFTDVPFRLIAIVDGGTRSDLAPLEAHLKGCDFEWTLLHNKRHEYLNSCIRDASEQTRHKLVALIAPQVQIDDGKWFGKMQQVFLKDPICGIVDTIPNTLSSTAPPIRRQMHKGPEDGCRFVLLSQHFLCRVPPMGKADPVAMWANSAMRGGGTAWLSSGVRYQAVEHTEHEVWREPSAKRERSKSPSQTTPASFTPMTTDRDG